MKGRCATMVAWVFCLWGSPTLASSAPDADEQTEPRAREEYSPFHSSGSEELIDPGSVSRVRQGASEADPVDTPTEEFVTFASILWVFFTSDMVFGFEHLEPSEAELGFVLDVARRSRVLAAELQQIRKQSMCRRLHQYREQGFTAGQSMELAIEYYESAEVKHQEYEDVAAFIRAEIERELGADFLSALEREAELHADGSTSTKVSARRFGRSDEEFVADCGK